MRDEIIEPSEIIVEQTRSKKEDVRRVNPWMRFLARFLDYSLFFLVLWGLRVLLHGRFPFAQYEHLIPFEFFIWIPVEALFLHLWGTTPGKFLLRIQLQHGRRNKLDYRTALRRSFSVWFRGLGMGIPILSAFCLLVAYNKLKVLHSTSWDREDHILITHQPVARWRLVFAIFVAIFGLLSYYSEKNTVLERRETVGRKHI